MISYKEHLHNILQKQIDEVDDLIKERRTASFFVILPFELWDAVIEKYEENGWKVDERKSPTFSECQMKFVYRFGPKDENQP